MGSNETQVASVSRIRRSIGVLYPLLENFDCEQSVQKSSSKYERERGHGSSTKNLFNFHKRRLDGETVKLARGYWLLIDNKIVIIMYIIHVTVTQMT